MAGKEEKMALEFKCPECGDAVVVGFMKVAQAMPCPHCFKDIVVPESAVPTEKSPTPRKRQVTAAKAWLEEPGFKLRAGPGAFHAIAGVLGAGLGIVVIIWSLSQLDNFGGEQIAIAGAMLGFLYLLVGILSVGISIIIEDLRSLRRLLVTRK